MVFSHNNLALNVQVVVFKRSHMHRRNRLNFSGCLISLLLNVIGQQLVQMPDGKLHVFSTAQAGAATATQPASPRPAAPAPATQQVTVVKTPGGQPIIRQLRPVTPLKSNTVAGKPGQVMLNLYSFFNNCIPFKKYLHLAYPLLHPF